jgi:hypothetical protein
LTPITFERKAEENHGFHGKHTSNSWSIHRAGLHELLSYRDAGLEDPLRRSISLLTLEDRVPRGVKRKHVQNAQSEEEKTILIMNSKAYNLMTTFLRLHLPIRIGLEILVSCAFYASKSDEFDVFLADDEFGWRFIPRRRSRSMYRIRGINEARSESTPMEVTAPSLSAAQKPQSLECNQPGS